MLIAVFVDIVRDVVLSLLWLGGVVLALAAGWTLAVAWTGKALFGLPGEAPRETPAAADPPLGCG